MGVDVERFRRPSPYQPWDGAGPARIFSCGRLNPCKGHDDLIRAVSLLRDRGIQAHLHIAGEDDSKTGDCRRSLEELIAHFGIGDRVRLLGAVPEETVRAELEAAHLFALASLEEPLGVVIMEAMAMEIPVVVTGAGGVAELVQDEVDGLLVQPRKPDQLAEALSRVLQSPELARQLSVAGRRRILESFHSGLSAQVLTQCLNRVKAGPDVKSSMPATRTQAVS
jgi:glycosyltransferase involved in cell wall biosynthesis